MQTRIFVTAVLITCIFFSAKSQNVGIGTSTPTARLEIIGTGSTPTTNAFHVRNSAGTSLLMVKDNGNIGINTSLPGATLDIKGGLKITETGVNNGYVGFFAAMGSGATFYTWPPTDGMNGQVLTTSGTGYLSWTTPSSGGGTGSTINCSTTSNSNYTVRGNGSGTWQCTNDLQISSTGYVSINTTPSSSYRLRVSGNVGIGSSPSSSYDLSVDGQGHFKSGVGVGTNPPSSGLYVGSSSNFYVPTSMTTGTYTAVYINSGRIYKASSSIRFKENITDLAFNKENFLKIRPVNFNYKKEFGDPSIKEAGVIAEDIEKLVPELVIYETKPVLNENGEAVLDQNGEPVYEKTNIPESVRYDRMPVYLISIAAEQEDKINKLQTQLDELLIKIDVLESIITEMKSTNR